MAEMDTVALLEMTVVVVVAVVARLTKTNEEAVANDASLFVV